MPSHKEIAEYFYIQGFRMAEEFFTIPQEPTGLKKSSFTDERILILGIFDLEEGLQE